MALFAVNLTAQNILTSPFTLGFVGDEKGRIIDTAFFVF